ncbi:hypothetical protein GCM10010515_48270 [Streptomyces fructofermentans]|uniref:Uncharacterized protein n=1 Tax=Streptomyces fructofermentans TaxID=152141 RepID=A0A918NKH6_9ACTN|nr:hypothetical protein GCM10010515_48270 [Streptomyces fructofermentans]
MATTAWPHEAQKRASPGSRPPQWAQKAGMDSLGGKEVRTTSRRTGGRRRPNGSPKRRRVEKKGVEKGEFGASGKHS